MVYQLRIIFKRTRVYFARGMNAIFFLPLETSNGQWVDYPPLP